MKKKNKLIVRQKRRYRIKPYLAKVATSECSYKLNKQFMVQKRYKKEWFHLEDFLYKKEAEECVKKLNKGTWVKKKPEEVLQLVIVN